MLPERIAGVDILIYARWQRDLAVYYWESWQLDGNQVVLLVEGRFDFPVNVFPLIGSGTTKNNCARRSRDVIVPYSLNDVIWIVAVNAAL